MSMWRKTAPFVMAAFTPTLVLVLSFFGLGYIGVGGGFTGAVWLFAAFAVVFGLAGLLLAWTFVGWTRNVEPEPYRRERRSPFKHL